MSCIGWLLWCWLVMTSVSVLADRMELIEGEVVEGSVQSIRKDGRWVLAGERMREVDGADVRLFAGKSLGAQRQGVEATSKEAGRILFTRWWLAGGAGGEVGEPDGVDGSGTFGKSDVAAG
ncbi:MAG: hypothetical protein HC898_12655 [Phycisphaerales bacterium]|nr:hypothetical protein [Phycisphaerales bacterium]